MDRLAVVAQPGGHSDDALAQLDDPSQADLCQALNRYWSNWILDEAMWAKFLAQGQMGLQDALEWCLRQEQARLNRSSGNIRESKLADALQRFRAALDRFLTDVNGPQQEGFIHQKLLAHALTTIGYTLTENPIGVPDITASRNQDGPPRMDVLREKLLLWHPSNPELQALRNNLLSASDPDLETVFKIFGG